MKAKHKNLIGPQVRKLRYQRGWRQKDLAAKLQIAGWDIDRGSVSKIESQLMRVGDFQILYLGKVLKVDWWQLFPAINPDLSLHDFIETLRARK